MADDDNTLTPKRLYLALLIAVLGGNTGSIINSITPTVRSDPMTGTQGKELIKELHRIDKIQYLMDSRMKQRESQSRATLELIRQHMQAHP